MQYAPYVPKTSPMLFNMLHLDPDIPRIGSSIAMLFRWSLGFQGHKIEHPQKIDINNAAPLGLYESGGTALHTSANDTSNH